MTRFTPFARSTVAWMAACLLLFLFPAAALSAPTQAYQAEVIGIADGDTITVLQGATQIKIRLYGIDCPKATRHSGVRPGRRGY